jgi:hypothetical protein
MNRNQLGSDGKMRCRLPKIILINPQTVEGSEFNPDSRTSDSALKELEDVMDAMGYFPWLPVAVDKNMIVRDGHRRVAVAKKLGYVEIPAIVVDWPIPAEAWTIINGVAKKNLTQKERMRAYLTGLPSIADYKSGKQIKEIVRLGGDKLAQFVDDSKKSSNVVVTAQRIAYYANEYKGSIKEYIANKSSDDYIVKTIRWLGNHKGAQVDVISAMRGKVDPKTIKGWIDGNKAPKISVT